MYFVEEQTGVFDLIPRSGLIKQLTRIKFSPISPLTDNPTVKGYVNPENVHERQSLKSRTKLSLRQANCIDPSVFPIILARQFTTSSICSMSAWKAAVQQLILASGTLFHRNDNFLPLLIQEELVVIYWPENRHLILVNCLWEVCLGAV